MPPSVPVSQQSPAAAQQARRHNKTSIPSDTKRGRFRESTDGHAAPPSAEPRITAASNSKATRKNKSASARNTRSDQGDDTPRAASAPTSTADPATPVDSTVSNPMILGSSAGLYGGGYGGGMMGSPYYSSPYGYGGGMMPGGVMPGQPFSGLNQFLFSVQSIIFSLGQAVQVLGMNTQALQQLLDTASTMFDHALATWKEMRTLEAAAAESESEEDKKRRRRLRALRWAATVGLSYAVYKLVRRFFLSHRTRTGRHALLGTTPSASSPYDRGVYDGQYSQPGNGALSAGSAYSGSGYSGSYNSPPMQGGPFNSPRPYYGYGGHY